MAGHELLHAALSGRPEPILAELGRRPQDAALWELLGEAYANTGRHDEAVTAYRRAIAIEPKNSDAWWMLGITQACREDKPGMDEVQAALTRIDGDAAAQYRDLAPKGCCAFGGCLGSQKSRPDNKQMQRTRPG
jgi:tetratricopeptide (TPR) repeat protein